MEKTVLLKKLLEPLGITPRRFLVDYHDGVHYYHEESVIAGAANDDAIRNEIIGNCSARGYTVYSILEVISDLSVAELAAGVGMTPDNLKEHVRPLYMDAKREHLTAASSKSAPS